MKPIEFKEQTCILAKDQPQYLPLPVWRNETRIISCWKLSWFERLKLLWFGRVWVHQLHFGALVQPQLLALEYPFEKPFPR